MASSKVMASRSPPNPGLPRLPSTSALNLHPDPSWGFQSMNMDEILGNIYSDSDSFALVNNVSEGGGGGGGSAAGDGGMRNANGHKTVDEVWREIVSGAAAAAAAVSVSAEPGMTLEDFLAKAGAGNAVDVRVPALAVTMTPAAAVPAVSAFAMESVMMNPAAAAAHFAPSAVCVQNSFGVEFGNGMAVVSGAVGGGRGKRRAAVEEVPLDKATQQKQRRMIKNRESAARSRERKQAYTVELESLVTHLEEENARLLKEEVLNKLLYMQAELNKKRYKQLMGNLIPVVEKRRPPRVLRRVHSMEW